MRKRTLTFTTITLVVASLLLSLGCRKADPLIVDRDEHPRPETTLEGLGKLRAIRPRTEPRC